MRARWDGTNRPIGEGGVGDYIGGSGPIDSKERESVRRIAEIKKESEDRRKSPAAKARRARMEQMEWEPCLYAASGSSSGLPPTNTKDAGRSPAIVRTSGVNPPPARSAVPRQSNNAPSSSTTAAAAALAHTRLAGTRSAVSHLDAASLDAIHAEIAQLDLNLEPDEYMDGLSRIIRRALLPPGVAEDSEAAEALLSTLPGWGPPSPLSSSSSSSSTAIGDARDAGLTYRGRDVRDRLRESTYTLPSGRLPANMPSLQQAHEGLRAIMNPTDHAGTAGTTNNHVPPDEEIVEAALVAQVAAAQDATSALEYADQLARLRADRRERVLRAREIVIELARPRQQNTARSARELVDAATVIREDRTAGREARASERHAAYEVTVRAELRAAQAHRIRAFNRYQELVASRARRETRGPAQPAVPMPRPPTGRDIGTDAIITVIPVLSPTEREDAEMDEDMARQSFIAAQMREAAVQQRLLSAQNRLRVMTSVETSAAERLLQDQMGSMAIASDQREQPNRADAVSGRARPAGSRGNEMVRELAQRAAGVDDGVLPGGVGWASATRSARRTVGPRGEEPEDVDTLVRMRHLQETRPGTPERIEERRRNLAAIRQDLVARRRTHEAQRLAAAENVNTGADAGTDPSIQQLLLDAQHVNEARRSLYETLEQDHTDWEVTPSSPITATGNADYSHIQVSVGTSTESDEEFFRRRDETLRRAGYELHPAVMGVSGARVVRIGRTDLEETGRELLLPQPPYESAAVTPVAEPRASSSSCMFPISAIKVSLILQPRSRALKLRLLLPLRRRSETVPIPRCAHARGRPSPGRGEGREYISVFWICDSFVDIETSAGAEQRDTLLL